MGGRDIGYDGSEYVETDRPSDEAAYGRSSRAALAAALSEDVVAVQHFSIPLDVETTENVGPQKSPDASPQEFVDHVLGTTGGEASTTDCVRGVCDCEASETYTAPTSGSVSTVTRTWNTASGDWGPPVYSARPNGSAIYYDESVAPRLAESVDRLQAECDLLRRERLGLLRDVAEARSAGLRLRDEIRDQQDAIRLFYAAVGKKTLDTWIEAL